MRRGAFIFIATFLISTLILLIHPSYSHAIDIPGSEIFDNASPLDTSLQEFCEKRSGDQMNLETWYSGKCKDKSGKLIDSYTGEGVGFSSIVILDLAEKLNGKKDKNNTFLKTIQNLDTILNQLKSEGKSDNEIKIALNEERNKIINNNSITSGIGKTLSFLISNPPASTKTYISYVAQNLQKNHVISSAYAASPGVGYSTFTAFLPLWKITRNLSYILFIFVFVLYGFMMMFRVNINAKTVISIQLALPKLIFTLLIITFSYAIVGFMMDLMYLFFYIFINILDSQNIIYAKNIFVIGASGQLGSLLSATVNTFTGTAIAAPIGIINFIIGGSSLISGIIAAGFGVLGVGLFIGLIVSVAIIISYIKLTWKLIQSFLEIIISLITAPIVLLGNALPGSNVLNTWMTGIFANMSVFPITMILLTFSYILMVQPATNLCQQTYDQARALGNGSNICEYILGVKNLNPGGYVPYIPFISPASANFGGGNAPDAIMALFGVALLLMASKYVDIVKDALKVPAFKYGSAISDALKVGSSRASEWLPQGGPRIPLPGRLSNGITSLNDFAVEQARKFGGGKKP